MWTGFGIVSEVIVACWIVNYLWNKFDPAGDVKTALHKLIVTRLTSWASSDPKSDPKPGA